MRIHISHWIQYHEFRILFFSVMNSYIFISCTNSYRLWIRMIISYKHSYGSWIHMWILGYNGSRWPQHHLVPCACKRTGDYLGQVLTVADASAAQAAATTRSNLATVLRTGRSCQAPDSAAGQLRLCDSFKFTTWHSFKAQIMSACSSSGSDMLAAGKQVVRWLWVNVDKLFSGCKNQSHKLHNLLVKEVKELLR